MNRGPDDQRLRRRRGAHTRGLRRGGCGPDAQRVTTVEECLAWLPEARRTPITAVRDVVNAHLPDGPEAQWFRDQHAERGMRLDIGRSCVRFKRVDDLPLGPGFGRA